MLFFSLEEIFPKSNPNAIFSEIITKYELCISTWLGYDRNTKQDIEFMSDLTVNIFEDIFDNHDKQAYILLNHWDFKKDMYMLNQFDAYKYREYRSRVSVDETQEEQREQFFMMTPISEINYQKIFRRFVRRDYDLKDETTSRIFFVNSKSNCIYYILTVKSS